MAVLIPNVYGQAQDEYRSAMTFGAVYIAFYCGDSISIVANSLTLGFHITWVKLAYERPFGTLEILSVVALVIGSFVIQTWHAMQNLNPVEVSESNESVKG